MNPAEPLADRLLNHRVRAQQQRLRDGDTERLRGFEVDDQLELRRLLDGEVGRLRALEDLVDVYGGAADEIGHVHCVSHQAACLDAQDHESDIGGHFTHGGRKQNIESTSARCVRFIEHERRRSRNDAKESAEESA